jgi:hypothetical protein
MTFAVVEVHDDPVRGMSVRTFGPYATAEQAERERRSRHMAHWMAAPSWQRLPHTFVTKIEEMSE